MSEFDCDCEARRKVSERKTAAPKATQPSKGEPMQRRPRPPPRPAHVPPRSIALAKVTLTAAEYGALSPEDASYYRQHAGLGGQVVGSVMHGSPMHAQHRTDANGHPLPVSPLVIQVLDNRSAQAKWKNEHRPVSPSSVHAMARDTTKAQVVAQAIRLGIEPGLARAAFQEHDVDRKLREKAGARDRQLAKRIALERPEHRPLIYAQVNETRLNEKIAAAEAAGGPPGQVENARSLPDAEFKIYLERRKAAWGAPPAGTPINPPAPAPAPRPSYQLGSKWGLGGSGYGGN